jgi:hypothetical protein
MAKTSGTEGRESGTGQDTHKVCVPVPPRTPPRTDGHGGTLSRPVPLSRIGRLSGEPHLLDRPSRLYSRLAFVNQHQEGRMSGRRSRRKGGRTERSIVNALKASGIAAVRVPLFGAVGGRFGGDIVLPLMGRDLCVEVKARADGFREL